jgi:hypothetical protein
MAIWQYTFELIPKEDLSLLSDNIELESYSKFNFWEGGGLDFEYFTPITQLLPMGKSWHKDIRIYGNEDSNCIKLVTENNKIVEVIIRIDFRSDYSNLLSTIIEFCKFNSLVLLDERFTVMSLNEINIDYVIKSSSQYIKLKEGYNKKD